MEVLLDIALTVLGTLGQGHQPGKSLGRLHTPKEIALRFTIGFISQTVEHLCITNFFLDTELLEIFASVLILVSSYHLGVVLSFFLVVHCNLVFGNQSF